MPQDNTPVRQPAWRSLFAEFLGTALLVVAMIGAANLAAELTIGDKGLQHLQHSVSIGLALAVLIAVFAPISGAHLNPAVSLAVWALGRNSPTALSTSTLAGYIIAQFAGGVFGAIIAAAMFELPVTTSSAPTHNIGELLGEVIATFSLVLVILTMIRTNRPHLIAPCAGAIIGAAYWYTSSTALANPAATIARIFTDSLAGVSPASVPGFIAAQLVGAGLAAAAAVALAPAPTHSKAATEQGTDTVDLTQGAQLPEQSRTDSAQ